LVPALSTVALNCTVALAATFCGIGVICTDTCGVLDPTVCVSRAEKLAAKFESPKYSAVMDCEPAGSDEVVSVATPLLLSGLVVVLMGAPLSRKLTLPVGVAPEEFEPVTKAVKRTAWPTAD